MASRKHPQRNVHGEHSKSLIKLLESVSGPYHMSRWDVFQGFVAFAALTTATALPPSTHPEHAKRLASLREIQKKHEQRTLDMYDSAYAALKHAINEQGGDVLGDCFMGLDLGSNWSGQFFTPYTIARMMAMMNADEADLRERIVRAGCVRIHDPAVGAGCLPIATHDTIRDIDPALCEDVHYTVVDVDTRCVQMCFTQLALRNIPAIIIHGNSLSLEEYEHWYTPAHILGNWDARLVERERRLKSIPENPAA